MTEDTRRLTRRQLYDLVWKTPVDTLAKELGLSGRGLGKLCERHSIPVPPRGYWARKSAGQKMKRPPLVELGDAQLSEFVLDLTSRRPTPVAEKDDTEATPDLCREFFERQIKEIGILRVATQLRNPHSIIAAWLNREEIERRQARNAPAGWRYFQPRFATPLARRRLMVLDVLFRELERRSCKIAEDRNRGDVLTVRMGWDEVGFTVSEAIRQIRRRLTEEEKAKDPTSRQVWTQIREPTGELVLKLSGGIPRGTPQTWQDQSERPLETQLVEVLAGILTALAYVRAERERRTAEERRRHEREEEERRREAERQAEFNRKLGLRQRADAWQVAAQIRSYVAAVRDAAAKGDVTAEPAALEEWSRWALAHADEFDPLQAGTALGTERLWDEDQRAEESFGQRFPGRQSGDPNWFWGRRWWLKG